MRTLCRNVVAKKEFRRKAKLSLTGQSKFLHSPMIMNCVQAAKKSFLRTVSGPFLRNEVRSSIIKIEPLLLGI